MIRPHYVALETNPNAGTPLELGLEPEPWRDDALCSQTDPESFFPEKGGSTREAKAICRACNVAAECLTYALEHEERFGVWGGLSEQERRKLMRLPDDTGACGTYPRGFNRHTRRGEKPCEDCRLAANAYARERRATGRGTPVDITQESA